jgi:hypothetical protein
MNNVVPGPLRRLREADIIDMAGLKSAALGQEYFRIGAVHTTMQRGSQITGIVDVPASAGNNASEARLPGIVGTFDSNHKKAASATNRVEEVQEVRTTEDVDTQPGRYSVLVEIRESSTWNATCTCHTLSDSSYICPHAAALLYQWLTHPMTFVSPRSASSDISTSTSTANSEKELTRVEPSRGGRDMTLRPLVLPPSPLQPGTLPGEQASVVAPQFSEGEGNITELLSQLGLSELRTLAREYDITKTGLNKQQLVEAIVEALKQPEMIRRVVGTLEKPQRQLLAALTLAGGMVTDEELRGLYERFSLGYPNQLQTMLSALRSKCLLFHTSFNSSLKKHVGMMGSLLVGAELASAFWYVPSEVRVALRVTVPITPFDVQSSKEDNAEAPRVQQIKPYSLVEDLLLVARALDGQTFDKWGSHERIDTRSASYAEGSYGDIEEGGRINRTIEAKAEERVEARSRPYRPYAIPADGLMLVPPPREMPSPTLLASLRAVVPRPADFLLFAICLLRLVDILYKDDAGTPYLRILPNAARLLLSPMRTEVARDLFVRWLTQPTYAELFELQEEGLRLRCRSGPLGRPALRTGELEMENTEARQMLVALLAKVPLNQWISFSAFARFVYRLNPAFLQKRHHLFSSPPWWLEQEEGRTLHPTQLNDWLRAEGRYIARLLCGPLHWWGISDLALSNSGQLLAFRLTPLASLLQGGGEPRPSHTTAKPSDSSYGKGIPVPQTGFPSGHPKPLTLSETGDILISSSSVAWPLIELLEDFAEVAGVQSGLLRYRLTATSLSEAMSRGLNPTSLLQLLHQHAEPSLVPLLAQLECRIKNYGRVRLYTDVTLLEVADTPVIRELSATTPLEEQIVRTIHPTLLILKKQGADRLMQDLKRRGQSPLLHEEEDYGAE